MYNNDNYSMEPRFNKDLGTMKITLFRYIRFLVISGLKKNTKSWTSKITLI